MNASASIYSAKNFQTLSYRDDGYQSRMDGLSVGTSIDVRPMTAVSGAGYQSQSFGEYCQVYWYCNRQFPNWHHSAHSLYVYSLPQGNVWRGNNRHANRRHKKLRGRWKKTFIDSWKNRHNLLITIHS